MLKLLTLHFPRQDAWRVYVRFCQLDTTVKWHPICSTNVKELHGTCLGKKKNPRYKRATVYHRFKYSCETKASLCYCFLQQKYFGKVWKYFFFAVIFYIRRWKKRNPFHTFAIPQKSESLLLQF